MDNEKPKNHPGVAAVLSFVFNGLGQLYNGDIKKGLWIMTGTSFCLTVIILGAILAGFGFWAGTFSLWQFILGVVIFLIGVAGSGILGAYSINDAYRGASKK